MTRPKTLIVGAAGQLAADLITTFSNHDLILCRREDLDITNADQVEQRLLADRPRFIVNAAAYNLVDQAESEPAAAFAVNAFGPLNLAKACSTIGATLVHFSTDYVFGLNNMHDRPWTEEDPPGPISVYGTSKLAGEQFVRAYCPQHYVLRTCGLYGVKGSRGKGGNFVETMLRLAGTGKPVRVVNDQRCTPSFTFDVAQAAAQLIRHAPPGLYHLTNSDGCSWHEFACAIFQQAGLKVDCQPITTAEYPTKARRPDYSVLSSIKRETFGVAAPHWKDALGRYLKLRPPR